MAQKSEENSIANKIIARIRVQLGNSLCKGVWAEVPVLLGLNKMLKRCEKKIQYIK